MGILDSTLRQQCSSLLWFALPPSSPVSQRPSLRLSLILPCSTEPMAMVPILTPTEPMEPMDMPDTPMPIMASTMARGLPRLSPRLMLMPTTMAPTDWDTMVWATDTDTLDTPMPVMVMPTMERGPLMPSPPLLPSPMLMPTMATTVMAPGPTTDWDTEDTDWDTEATTGDKFSAFEVQSRSSKRTSLLVI